MEFKNKGQSLFEIIIAIGLAAIIIGSATTAIIVSLKTGKSNVDNQKAYAIAQDILNNVRSYADANWSDIYSRDTNGTYHLYEDSVTATSTELALGTGTTTFD